MFFDFGFLEKWAMNQPVKMPRPRHGSMMHGMRRKARLEARKRYKVGRKRRRVR